MVGGTGCEEASKDPALVDWVRSMAPKARRVASVCSGAFILAAAGLLHHRRVTTHWIYSDRLAKTYPTIDVDANLIFVRDGNIYTSGGITTGIDLALALVEEDLGPEVMLGVARALIVFPKRPGGQSQFKAHTPKGVGDPPILSDGRPMGEDGALLSWQAHRSRPHRE